jgi:3-deoxy-D-manno-octulosonate 8-phosphate phosphatase (KDO 8-P phosphatase)
MLHLFKTIKTFIFDVDGVLATDGLLVMPDGEFLRTMNSKDGYALQLAVKKGYDVVIISGGNSKPVEQRLIKLGVKDVFMGVHDKKPLLQQYATQHNLSFTEILYMGDDIPDYDAMQLAALPCCPADAVPEIQRICKYISPFKGGYGCARDVIEKVLKLNGHWSIETGITST